MSERLSESPVQWHLHALATGVPLTVASWLVAHRTWSGWLLVPAGLHLAVALVHPGYARAAYRGGMRFHRMVSSIISGVILSLVFLLIITPVGLLLRLSGRDPLSRRPGPDQPTNWHPAAPFTPTGRMF